MNLFGTDGIRGKFGSSLFEATAFLLGKALTEVFPQPLVVVCRDTRLSGQALAEALAKGVYSGGGNVLFCGVLPTNAVSFLTRYYGAAFGVMVSASHNPPCDNGLKVFDANGMKICREKQIELSEKMSRLQDEMPSGKLGLHFVSDAKQRYVEGIFRRFDLEGVDIVVDCCHGAASGAAMEVFQKTGAKAAFVNCDELGEGINVDCGATHVETLLAAMDQTGKKLGFAVDGDADRIVVAEKGRALCGERALFVLAKYFAEKGNLSGGKVVGTVLTNGGLDMALRKIGLQLVRSDVGDGNVLAEMLSCGANVGGEESGHFLLTDYALSADALLSCALFAQIFKEKGSLRDYSAEYASLPFVKCDLSGNEVEAKISDLHKIVSRVEKLFPDCRVVLRKSGTEDKIRLYVEGDSCEQAQKVAVAALKNHNDVLTKLFY